MLTHDGAIGNWHSLMQIFPDAKVTTGEMICVSIVSTERSFSYRSGHLVGRRQSAGSSKRHRAVADRLCTRYTMTHREYGQFRPMFMKILKNSR